MFTTAITGLSASFDNYIRLAKTLDGMSSLWKGDDHLVHVRGRGFVLSFAEDYKRYRFSDIEAFAISRRSRWGKAALLGIGIVLSLLPVVLILAFLDEDGLGTGAAVSLSIFSLLALCFVGMLVRHLALGPLCVCEIQTSVSRDRLVPLDRLHRAQEVLGGIEAEIRAAQSSMPPVGEGVGKFGAAVTVPGVPVLVFPALGAALAFALATLAAVHLESPAMVVVALFLVLVLGSLLMAGIVASVRRPTPETVRASLWISLGLEFVFIGAAIVYFLATVADNPGYTLDLTGPLEVFAALATEGGWIFYSVFLVLSLGMLAASAVGLVAGGKAFARSSANATLGEATEVAESSKRKDDDG